MALQFVNVRISRMIVHEIFGRDPTVAPRTPALSTACTTVTGAAKNTFIARLANALGKDSHCIEMDIDKDGPTSTFQLSASALTLTSDRDFAEVTGTIAASLQRAQASALIPGGIVIVFSGTVGPSSKRFVAIIKAEVQEGFRKHTTGDQTSLELLQDLFLTPQQKLYKIGLFLETNHHAAAVARLASDFEAYVYDSNMTHNESASAAKYFAEEFLGCSIPKSAKHLTAEFYRLTKAFIDTNPAFDDARKLDLTGALYTYLRVAQNRTISSGDFSSSYLQSRERQQYASHMSDGGFPERSISKDLGLISSQLRRIKMRFSSDVSISAPAENFTDLLKVERETSTHTYLKVSGKIRK